MHLQQKPVVLTDAKRSAARIAGLDAARFITSLGVIWLHAGYSDYNVLGRFRMPFFTTLLAYLVAVGTIRDASRTIGGFLKSRAWRMLLPFALWVVLYRIPNLVQGRLAVPLTFDNLLMGWGAIPLWFLPFAFVASFLALIFSRGVLPVGAFGRISAAAALCLLGVCWSFGAVPSTIETLWKIGLPLVGAIMFGVALGFLKQVPRVNALIAREWVIWILLWVLFALLSMSLDMRVANLMGVISGVFLMLAGLSVPLPRWKMWSTLGKLSYGMFLTHWAFMLALEHLGLKGEGTALPRFAIMTAGSIATSLVLQRMSLGRFLLGIETPKARPPQPQVMADRAAERGPEAESPAPQLAL